MAQSDIFLMINKIICLQVSNIPCKLDDIYEPTKVMWKFHLCLKLASRKIKRYISGQV